MIVLFSYYGYSVYDSGHLPAYISFFYYLLFRCERCGLTKDGEISQKLSAIYTWVYYIKYLLNVNAFTNKLHTMWGTDSLPAPNYKVQNKRNRLDPDTEMRRTEKIVQQIYETALSLYKAWLKTSRKINRVTSDEENIDTNYD